MKIMSESIADYIDINYDIEEFNDISELSKVEELVINSYNYSLDIAPFYPNELCYFNNLKECTFMNFEINDEIINNLNNINLRELSLDNCKCSINSRLKVDRLFVEGSSINLKNIDVKGLIVLESGTVNISDLNNNMNELTLLNCDIVNCNLLRNFSNCKIKLVGCKLDDESIINLENVKYDREMYVRVG